jgi:hypothetical protein
MPADSTFHRTGAEQPGFAPVRVFIPKGDVYKSRGTDLLIGVDGVFFAKFLRAVGPRSWPFHCLRMAKGQTHAQKSQIRDNMAMLNHGRKIFSFRGESRIHLRGSRDSRMPLLMSGLLFSHSDILNSLSELLTELARSLRGQVSKCICRNKFINSNLRYSNLGSGSSFSGLAQALHIGRQNQVLK